MDINPGYQATKPSHAPTDRAIQNAAIGSGAVGQFSDVFKKKKNLISEDALTNPEQTKEAMDTDAEVTIKRVEENPPVYETEASLERKIDTLKEKLKSLTDLVDDIDLKQ